MLNLTRKMGLSVTIISVSLMMMFVSGSLEFTSDAFAIKSQGNALPEVGSKKVCGDRLCGTSPNEMEKKTDATSISTTSMNKEKDSAMMIKKDKMSMNNKMMITEDTKLATITMQKEDVGFEFSAPETIIAKKLVPINARVFDNSLDANLSHTDWSYSVTNSAGDIIHKSTTLHGHYGVMNFKVSFPDAGIYTVSYSILSSGPFMLGKPIPELGQTRAVVSGDLLKFEEDPKNNFGSRTFEVTVDVIDAEQIAVVHGSEPDTAYKVKLTTQPTKVIAGQPATIILDVNDYNTGEDATHVDGLVSMILPQHYYQSEAGDQPEDAPIPLHGAYHGHLGLMSITQTFPKSGTVLLDVKLSTIPYSVPLFGEGSTQFAVEVFDSGSSNGEVASEMTETNTIDEDKVDIVGIESPFYTPNTITVSIGQTITFDNVDGNYHTVTSVKSGTSEHDGKFDSGLMNAGDKYELTLDEAGTYEYFCSLHTGMKGTIIVS